MNNINSKQAYNPFLPSYEYIPDVEPYVFGDRVYIYGSHDQFNGKMFCVGDYVCWSASIDNLTEWRFDGCIYKKGQDPKYKNGSYMYAPDIVKGLDGRYYLYYCLSKMNLTSIAVSDKPNGPYKYYGYVQKSNGEPAFQKSNEPFHFDPAVFVDSDNQIYMYTGISPSANRFGKKMRKKYKKKLDGAYVIKLEKDMKTIIGEPKLIVEGVVGNRDLEYKGHEFFEASSIRKIGNIYYFIYSSINSHELCYATSNSPLGKFKYRGTIISNGDLYLNGHCQRKMGYNYTGNNHGSLVNINGSWYVFYQRHTNRNMFSRQAMAEKVKILEDGSIPQTEMTSCGLNDGLLKGKGKYDARIACHLMSKEGTGGYGWSKYPYRKRHPYITQTENIKDEYTQQYIANIVDGCTVGFKYFEINDLKKIAVFIRGKASGGLYIMDSYLGNVV